MSMYQTFNFDDYSFDAAEKLLTLRYSIDDALHFTETYRFDFEFAAYNEAALDRALQQLFFMAGISYYKTYLPAEIMVKSGSIDAVIAGFLGRTWQKGLGEFFYVNQLDPLTNITFPITSDDLPTIDVTDLEGSLIGLGGGKDSLLSVELLRGQAAQIATWSVGHAKQLQPLVERTAVPHYSVERTWDRQLLDLNKQGAYNGHVPISAILACTGTVTAILSGKRDVVVSNEKSANEPTLEYNGVSINHQYSKSVAFEQDYQKLLLHNFGDSTRYYSLLRPLSELRIAELFSGDIYTTYKDVFSSCNRAFTHTSDHMFWDGTCPKCAFVFLALSPFVGRAELESLFSGKNLLLDPSLEPTYRQLLGIEGDKPLECVGEVKESRAAMRLTERMYPELTDKYSYFLPDGYDYRAIDSHEMPEEVWATISSKLV